MRTWLGAPFPLGATARDGGTNFAIVSEAAEKVLLCLFDDDRNETQIELHELHAFVWHAFVPGVGLGQRYGYRVRGNYEAGARARTKPAKGLSNCWIYDAIGFLDPHSAYAVSFDRGGAITVASRLSILLAADGGWGDGSILVPHRAMVDVIAGARFDGGAIETAALLAHYPVALLAPSD